jgi:hypothetical protein
MNDLHYNCPFCLWGVTQKQYDEKALELIREALEPIGLTLERHGVSWSLESPHGTHGTLRLG